MKGLFEQGLSARFRTEFPGLVLAIDRFVEASVLRDAVGGNRIGRVRLVRLERPGERRCRGPASGSRRGAATARVALGVAAIGRGRPDRARPDRALPRR